MSEALAQELFSAAENARTYAVLDGASVPQLPQALYQHKPDHECLYIGDMEPDMAEVAPYLVLLEPGHPFTQLVLEQGWGQHWGIFVVSEAGIRELRQHFRRFLTVYDPEGKAMLFRYYDPRVLRTFLPTCNADELTKLFGPVKAFAAEGDTPAAILWFEQNAGQLVKRSRDLARA